jgi:hypothetical protein
VIEVWHYYAMESVSENNVIKYDCCSKCIATIVRVNLFEPRGVNFISSVEDLFQIGIMQRDQKSPVQQHMHNKIKREMDRTSEFIYIIEGSCAVRFSCNCNSSAFTFENLHSGDAIIFHGLGVHGIDFTEPTKLIEVKQGPYIVNQDKRVID